MNTQKQAIPAQNPKNNDVLETILAELKPIDFYSIVGKEDAEIRRKHYLIEAIAEILDTAEKLNNPIRIKDGLCYIFNGIFWKVLKNDALQRFLGKASLKLSVSKYYSEHHEFQTELLKQLFAVTKIINPVIDDNVRINLSNGTLVISEEVVELKAYSPEDFFTYQLPFEFNTAGQCPTFLKFVDRVLPDKEQQKILAEYLGYVFIKHSKLKLEKCMVLYGSGANGKSVVYEIVSALLGQHNISNYSLQALTNTNGYYRALLAGKLLNYGSEISAHMDPELFKQLVSGEAVGARLPYGNPFELTNYAKLMFNANTLPADVDQNEAYFRRFLIIHFGVTIPEEERDPNFAKAIIDNELPGVFNWVLEGLDRLVKQKRFTESEAVTKQVKDYKEMSDSVVLFLKDENYETSNEHEISLKVFNEQYRKYALASGYKPVSRNELTRRMRKYNVSINRKNTGNFVGVKKTG